MAIDPPSFSRMRLIVVAVLMGAVSIAAVLSGLVLSGAVPAPIADFGFPYVDVAAAVVGLASFGLAFVFRNVVLRQPSPPDRRPGLYFAAAIVFVAMLEMGMVVNAVATLFVASPWVNLTIVGLGLAIGLNFLPSEDHYKGLTW